MNEALLLYLIISFLEFLRLRFLKRLPFDILTSDSKVYSKGDEIIFLDKWGDRRSWIVDKLYLVSTNDTSKMLVRHPTRVCIKRALLWMFYTFRTDF
jgi:hypothetical protein